MNLIANSQDAERVHVLLVEDSPSDAELTKEALNRERFSTISHVENGEDALNYLQKKGKYAGEETPDLVLLDLNLPGKNGLEVLAEVRSDPVVGLIPVIVLTTSSALEDVNAAYKMHANCYISKPGSMSTFVDAMKAMENFWLRFVQFPRV